MDGRPLSALEDMAIRYYLRIAAYRSTEADKYESRYAAVAKNTALMKNVIADYQHYIGSEGNAQS